MIERELSGFCSCYLRIFGFIEDCLGLWITGGCKGVDWPGLTHLICSSFGLFWGLKIDRSCRGVVLFVRKFYETFVGNAMACV